MNLTDKKLPIWEKLQKAVELEFSTIPPYLVAMYSIKPNTNTEAKTRIRTVFMEEMLHMLLAANVLNATGGNVKLGKGHMPSYPLQMKFQGTPFRKREFDIHLAALSKETLETFLKIELPDELSKGLLEEVVELPGFTIGEFYTSIKLDLAKLCEEYGEEAVFCGNPAYQLSEQYYWSASGKAITVKDLKSANEAIDTIIEQGEGAAGSVWDADQVLFDQQKELAHYFKFNEIYVGKRYKPTDKPKAPPSGEALDINLDAVYPIKKDCTASDFNSTPLLAELNHQFNTRYSLMLAQLQAGFEGNPRLFYTAIMNGMHGLTSIALNMVQVPIDGDPQGRTGCPTFEWADPDII
jgi:hypothetical protein